MDEKLEKNKIMTTENKDNPTFENLPQDVRDFRKELKQMENTILKALQASYQSEEKDEIMTADKTAELLNVSLKTLYGYVKDNRIPFMKPPGKLYYFSKLEVLNWLKTYRNITKSESEQRAIKYRKKRA